MIAHRFKLDSRLMRKPIVMRCKLSSEPLAKWCAPLLATGVVLAACLLGATMARAADAPYKEMPVDPPSLRGWDKARTSPQSNDPRAMLRGDAEMSPPVFDAFFNNILFPQFTLYRETDDNGQPILANVLTITEDPKNKTVKWRASKLPTCREEFLNQFMKQARDPEPFNRLSQLTVQAMRTIALGNYHPLSRYNAALLLSSLHEYQSEKPLRSTLPALMACMDSTDLVQVAALDGLLKHAKAGTDGVHNPQVVAAMLKIVKQKTPPTGRTPDGNDWLRRRALDVLAALGDAGPNMAVVAAIDSILKDNQSSPELSCSAAKALGSIAFHAPDAMNPSATATSIGQIAVDAYKSELARADERHEAALAAAAESRGGGGPFGAGGSRAAAAPVALPAALEHELFVSIPLLRSELNALDVGLKGEQPQAGLIAATSGAPQKLAQKVEQNIALLIAACDPGAADYEHLNTAISKAGTGLEAALGEGGSQSRAPAVQKTTGASKEDSFDSDTATPPAGQAPAAAPAVRPATR